MECYMRAKFDVMSPEQERLAEQFCMEIAGKRGEAGRNPDVVQLLEMAEALYTAECPLPTALYRTERIYIAGPMTGLPDLNFPAFNAAAATLGAAGWHVENPADHGEIEGYEWADYLALDLQSLGTCGAIYLLPGWRNSKGATLEEHIARTLGMKVIYAPGAELTASHPEVLAATYSKPAVPQWRPVATCVMDGRQVWAGFHHSQGAWVQFLAWATRERGVWAKGYAEPTHFMELPEGPAL